MKDTPHIMRCLSVLILFHMGPLCLGQQPARATYSYFEIENREVIWSFIYSKNNKTANELRESMIDLLKQKIWISKIEPEQEDLIVTIENYVVEYKKLGGSYMRTPLVIRSGRWSAKAKISFKEGRYRVMLFGLNYLAQQTTVQHGRIRPVDTELSGTWSDFVLTESRMQFRKSKFKALHLMHESLKDNFMLPDTPTKKDEDW